MPRLLLSTLTATVVLLAVPLVPPAHGAPRSAQVTVVQAVPGSDVDVSIDGRPVATGAGVGDVLGPFELDPGEHAVEFRGTGGVGVESTLDLEAGSSSDVVLHLPAEVGAEPVVHSYLAPTSSIGPGKARVVLAHTATVAPADVEVDGAIVFRNIANGEFAEADVPAGTLQVALLPTGSRNNPILGPVDVTLEARTLSMIYAYGNPRDGSMNVIAHTTRLEADGSVAPTTIDTGAAGLARRPVGSFGSTEASGADGAPGRAWPAGLWVLAVAAASALLVAGRRWRAGTTGPTPTTSA